MPRTGATRRDAEGPFQAFFSRMQSGSASGASATDTPDGRLTDSAIQSLGLKDQPFRTPGGQIPYFYNDQLEALLDELEACVGSGETLVVIEGADEAGKTCTVAQLLERFYDGGHVFLSRAGSGVSADSVIRSMLSAYRSTTPQSLSECTDQLVDHLAEHAELGAASVLVIEDAERMPTAELQKLLTELDTLNSQLGEPLSVLLSSAEPAETFLEGVRSLHIDASQVDAFSIPRLDANETASYIATRLAAAGHEGALPLDERELQIISHNSNGLPGYIDRNAARTLNQIFNRQRLNAMLVPSQWWRATRQHLRWVLVGISMLVLGLALGAWNAQPSTSSDTIVKALPLPANPGAGAVPEAPLSGTSDTSTVLKSAASRVEPVPEDIVVQPTPVPSASAETATATAAASTAATVEPVTPTPVETASTEASTAAEETASESTVVAATADVKETAEASASTPVAVASTEAANAEPAESTPAAAVKVEETAKPEPVLVAAVEPSATTESVPQTAAATEVTEQPLNSVLGGVISGAKWIERRDPNRFTVQLLAGADEAALRLHARKNNMTSLSAIYRTLRNGQPWFALVHGDFEDSVAAREAVATLPEVWQQNSPWIRRFDDVQKAIN